ncbi:MFS general substrate transporter [Leucogyrophana mollusca]|uniref:MFS general substrate transporter n=1 Tax=Leucogyrophana mollusca TaxID=85980 RepID=A0ACB8BI55_9AGAM|nr:MFS general substrate transporter [Leucogyrophana mollusca]
MQDYAPGDSKGSVTSVNGAQDVEKIAVPKLPGAPPPNFVEGGTHGYLTILGGFLNCFAMWGQINAFGSYQVWYLEHQLSNRSASEISWIGTLQLWVLFVSGSIIGRLFDAHGPRVLVISGTIIYTFSLMMTSLASQYYQFILAQGLLFGIGSGLLFFPCVSATATHFIKYRATAIGIVLSGAGVGGVVFPLLLQRLFNTVGFAWAVRITAFICLACGIVGSVTISSGMPKRKPGPWIDFASFRDAKFMVQTIGFSIACFGFFVPWTYLVQNAEANFLSQATSFDLLAVMNAGSTIGRLAPGYAADKIGRYNLMWPNLAISGILCLALWVDAHSLAPLAAFAALYGFFSGAAMALTTPCITQISRMDQIGTRVGMTYTFMSFPSLVGGPIAGAILAKQGGTDYSGLIIYTGIAMLIGAGFFFVVKLMINRNIFARV